jgi:hypothetical protein
MTSRRDILTFGVIALAGGCVGGFVERVLWDARRLSDAASIPPRGAPAERLANSIVVHDYSDGSGSASDDDDSITRAFTAAARSSWSRPVVFTRSFKVLAEHKVPFGASIEGIKENTILQPQTAMRCVFRVTGGNTAIRNLTCAYPRYLSTNLLPCDFICVDKPWDNYPVQLEKLRAVLSRNIVRWTDGDVPQIDGLWGVSNIRALHFENNGMNGRIANVFQLGGGGLYLGRNTAAARPQQMEADGRHNFLEFEVSASRSRARRKRVRGRI